MRIRGRLGRSAMSVGLLALLGTGAASPLRIASQGTDVRGTVVAFRTAVPIAGVEVGIAALGLTARTDSAGAFVFRGVVPGTHRFSARLLGYQMFLADFPIGTTAGPPLRIVLLPLQRLDSVEVVATPLTNALLEFEEHRRVGLGRFLTRDEIKAYDGMRMSSVLPNLSSVQLVRTGQRALLLSRRSTVGGACGNPRSGSVPGSPMYTPSLYEANRGVPCACFAQVYLDGTLQNPGTPAEPFDVNSIPVERIEAIEWYAGPSQTPVQYTRLNSACGVLVIHTRRGD